MTDNSFLAEILDIFPAERVLTERAQILIAGFVEQLVREEDLVHVDMQQRRLDSLTGLEVDERRVAHLQEELAVLVEDLAEAAVLVLDRPFDQEGVGEEEV